MKKFEFETSKGKFLLVDEKDYPVFHVMIETNGFNFYSLKQITERQASEIVDSGDCDLSGDRYLHGFRNYEIEDEEVFSEISAIESLHSLLISKGIHLFENPYDLAWKDGCISAYPYSQHEGKTFYNPYIFKL